VQASFCRSNVWVLNREAKPPLMQSSQIAVRREPLDQSRHLIRHLYRDTSAEGSVPVDPLLR
jgi:hypothetical protein